jgi:hypothetical protein
VKTASARAIKAALARAQTEDSQHVRFSVETDCEKIKVLGTRLQEAGAIDAYQEISPATGSVLLTLTREALPGCCAGCAVPVGLFKAMQVAAGLALPKDIHIVLSKE